MDPILTEAAVVEIPLPGDSREPSLVVKGRLGAGSWALVPLPQLGNRAVRKETFHVTVGVNIPSFLSGTRPSNARDSKDSLISLYFQTWEERLEITLF